MQEMLSFPENLIRQLVRDLFDMRETGQLLDRATRRYHWKLELIQHEERPVETILTEIGSIQISRHRKLFRIEADGQFFFFAMEIKRSIEGRRVEWDCEITQQEGPFNKADEGLMSQPKITQQ